MKIWFYAFQLDLHLLIVENLSYGPWLETVLSIVARWEQTIDFEYSISKPSSHQLIAIILVYECTCMPCQHPLKF